jgi:hypothetical protein
MRVGARRRIADGDKHPICCWRSFADHARRQSGQDPAFGGRGGQGQHQSGRGSPPLLADDRCGIDQRSARSGRRLRIGSSGERHHFARRLRRVGERRTVHRAPSAAKRILRCRRHLLPVMREATTPAVVVLQQGLSRTTIANIAGAEPAKATSQCGQNATIARARDRRLTLRNWRGYATSARGGTAWFGAS